MGENDDGNSSGGCNGLKILDGKAIEPKAIDKFDDETRFSKTWIVGRALELFGGTSRPIIPTEQFYLFCFALFRW